MLNYCPILNEKTMKKEEFVWEADFDDFEDRDSEKIRFEFEMDFGSDSDREFYSGSDLEYDA
jgi:hypothetical protein